MPSPLIKEGILHWSLNPIDSKYRVVAQGFVSPKRITDAVKSLPPYVLDLVLPSGTNHYNDTQRTINSIDQIGGTIEQLFVHGGLVTNSGQIGAEGIDQFHFSDVEQRRVDQRGVSRVPASALLEYASSATQEMLSAEGKKSVYLVGRDAYASYLVEQRLTGSLYIQPAFARDEDLDGLTKRLAAKASSIYQRHNTYGLVAPKTIVVQKVNELIIAANNGRVIPNDRYPNLLLDPKKFRDLD